MASIDEPLPSPSLPWELQVADWRRRIAGLYAAARASASGEEGWGLWVAVRRDLYARHPASPVPAEHRAETTIDVFPYDPRLRVTAAVEPLPREPVRAPSSGEEHAFVRFARARFSLPGGEHALELLWLRSYGNGVLLAFADATSGRSTYGGGRYLLDTAKSADLGSEDGRLVLDFNFAYAPSCAWDGAWSCPLAPAGNRLPVAVEGGERAPSLGDRVARAPAGRAPGPSTPA